MNEEPQTTLKRPCNFDDLNDLLSAIPCDCCLHDIEGIWTQVQGYALCTFTHHATFVTYEESPFMVVSILKMFWDV